MNDHEDQPEEERLARIQYLYRFAERVGQFGYWYWAVGSAHAYWSPGIYRVHGQEEGNGVVTFDHVMQSYVPADRAILAENVERATRSGQGYELTLRPSLPDGEHRHVKCLCQVEHGPDGGVGALMGVCFDVSHLFERESAVRHLTDRQADFIEVSSDWMWEMGPDLRFTYMSPQVEQVTGVPIDVHIGKTRRELAGTAELSVEMEMHLAWLEQKKPFRDFRFWREGTDGSRQYLSTSGKPFYDENGEFAGYRGSGRDLTAQQEASDALVAANRNLSAANKAKSDAMSRLRDANIALEERAAELEEIHARIRHSALTDPLTGIANRRHLDERLAECAVQCRISGGRLGALHIDLDRFKQINDTMGHAAGDAVLCHVAEVLSRSVPEDDFVARVGGDEFVVICSGHTGPFALGSLANRIIDEFSRPLIFEDRELWFGASVGIATQSGEEIDPESILVNADVALYRAKANGRNGFQLYSEAVQREIVAYKATADGILAGLKRGEFEPWYQPQVCARTMEIIGFEALARWRASDGSVRVPAAFLSVAKDLGVMASIDRCIMERAVSEIMEWRREGLNCPRVSVNVSARRLMDADLIESLGEINLPRGILVFELLESVFLDDIDDQIIWNIDMLREMGIEVELDDFGSGHASLISLIRLSPDAIKIDRQLISAMRDGDKRSDLVRSIVDIGHSLSVRVIAEGVETDDVAAKLAGIGCDVLQGFFVSEPLPASQIPGFIRHWESRIGIFGDANTAPRTRTK